MIDDTDNEILDLTHLLALHNSENLKRWIKFIELKNVGDLLGMITLPTFEQINIKINSISVTNHDTSYNFRPFFKKLDEMINEETTEREQALLDSLNITKIEDLRNTKVTNRIRLEQEILRRVIEKMHNILESSGNKYLEEGQLNNKYSIESAEFLANKTSKEAFYWFLDNAYIKFRGKSTKILLPKEKIMNLIETLQSELPEADKIENWTEWNVGFEQALRIIDAYEEFIFAFNEDFTIDRKILLSFSPYTNLSSGEKGLYDLFSILNDLNRRFNNNGHESYNIFYKRKEVGNNFLLLLDEGDLGFHPEWKKKYIKSLQQVIPFIFKGKNIQMIITTHDPLTLSDFPRDNVTYLKRKDAVTVIHADDDMRSFGANVSDLFKSSFFIKDGLIGDFAKDVIENLINKLNDWLNQKADKMELKVSAQEMENIRKTINVIDEPIIQQKLLEMYNTAFEETLVIDDEISRLEDKLRYLKKIKNSKND